MKNIKTRKLIVVYLVITGICLLAMSVYKFFYDYQAEKSYSELKDMFMIPADPESSDFSDTPSQTDSYEFSPFIYPDWNYLLSVNSDICAWIHMAPNISYPVAFGGDNSFYLHHSFDKSYAYAGCIFVNAANHPDFNDRNTILYGHNMRNRTMFGNLRCYRDSDYIEQYPYIYLYFPDGSVSTYEIFNVLTCIDGSAPYNSSMQSNDDMQEYLNNLTSIQKKIVTSSDSIITLSTCSGVDSEQRLVVQAVKIAAYIVQ